MLTYFTTRHGVEGTGRQIAKTAGRVELCRTFAALGFTSGVEVGVWTGDFAKQLCELVPGLHLTCVDPWRAYGEYKEAKNDQARLDAAFSDARQKLAPFNCGIIRAESVTAAKLFADRSLDFVYIDANHAEAFVTADLNAWAPKVRSGGIVAGHDYTLKQKHAHLQVTPAVDAYVKAHGIETFYVLAADKSPSFFWVQP